MRSSPAGFRDAPRHARFLNSSGEVIPPFAPMKVTGIDTNGDMVVGKPDRDHDNSGLVFNTEIAVKDGERGLAQISEPIIAAFESVGSSPQEGEIFGIYADKWALRRDRVGFRVVAVGADKSILLVVRMESQYLSTLRITDASVGGYYPAVEMRYDLLTADWIDYDEVSLKTDEALSVNDEVFSQLIGHDGTSRIFIPISSLGGGGGTNVTISTDGIPMKIGTHHGNGAYSWVEMFQRMNGTYAVKTGGMSGNDTINTTYELNARTDIANGTIVMGFPGNYTVPTVTCGTNQAGNGSVPEIHSVYISNALNGNFTLTYNNGTANQTTIPLDFNVNATVLELVLESNTTMGNLTVTGNGTSASDPFLIRHDDDNADHLPLTANTTLLVGERQWMFETMCAGTPNLSLAYNYGNHSLKGLGNTSANEGIGVPHFIAGGMTALSVLVLDSNKNMATALLSNLQITGGGGGARDNITLSANTSSGNGTPGNPNQSIQYNNGGIFGGFGNFNNTSNLTTLPGGLDLPDGGAFYVRSSSIEVRGATTALGTSNGPLVAGSSGSPTWGWSLIARNIGPFGGGGIEWSGNTDPTTTFTISPGKSVNGNSTLVLYANGTAFTGNTSTRIGLTFVGGILVGGTLSIDISDVSGLSDRLGSADFPATDPGDATDLTDIVAQFNTLLANLRTAGVIA